MHDDQHGTAVVVLAGIINALKVVKKELKIAASLFQARAQRGRQLQRFLYAAGARKILVLDRQGIIARDRMLEGHKKELAFLTNPNIEHGDLREALTEADILSVFRSRNLAHARDIKLMAPKAIVLRSRIRRRK
jgi:malate dehydrogenase (oxaloacetate-decarboxylating)